MQLFERPRDEDGEALRRERESLRGQIELLEDEWRGGMERDTLVLLDHACARLAEVDAALARLPEPALEA